MSERGIDAPLYRKLPENKVCTVATESAIAYAEDVNERLCFSYPVEVLFRSQGGEITVNKPPVGRYTGPYMLGTLARDLQNLGDKLIQEISEQSIPKTGNLDEKKEKLLEILSEQTWDFVQVSSPDFEGRGSVRDLLTSIILFGAEYLATDKIIRERDSEKNIDKIDVPEEEPKE